MDEHVDAVSDRPSRILCIDDEPDILEVVRITLENHGFDVTTMEDGEAALRAMEQTMPDLVILGVMMPGMDGYEVLERIREWSKVPVIILTAERGPEAKVTLLGLGADDYITSPFDVADLVARVRAALRRPSGESISDELISARRACLEEVGATKEQAVPCYDRAVELDPHDHAAYEKLEAAQARQVSSEEPGTEAIHVQGLHSRFPRELLTDYGSADLIGEGGFAKVFRAIRKRDGIEVAIKIPVIDSPSAGDTFLREIACWQMLSHRNIAKLHRQNVFPVPYLEMEFCPDGLEGLQKPMGMEQAATMVFDIAEGLKYAHSQGVIHRDLKPHNILLKDGIPKIVDWGLSKVASESKGTSRTHGHTFSLYWAAPEQLSTEKYGKWDHRTDIYQLGTIFYELVTGELPSKGGSITEIVGTILNDDPRPPSSVNPEASRVDAIIMKCLQKQMQDRYQSVEELQRDLANYLKLEYKESLKKSQGDMKRSGYYCAELCLVHLRMGDVGEALKYAMDLNNYSGEQVKADLAGLITELEYRSKEGVGIAAELMERAAIVLHQARMGR